jgi:Rap1a immunity proteins
MGTTARIILLTLSVALASSGAKAEEDLYSANHLLPGCKAFAEGRPYDAFAKGFCAGSIFWIGAMMSVSDNADACVHIPEQATGGQVARVVVRYMEQRPNRLHEPFGLLAAEALKDAWPCRNAGMR